MKTTLSLSLLVLGTAAAAAQTTPKAPVKHTPAATAHTTAAATAPKPALGGCVTVPSISPRIPALAASAGCPKALYTLTQHPSVTADFLSPMLSKEVRDELDFKSTTITLAYVDTQVGTGELVKVGKQVKVKYTGWTVEGNKFDSSDDHPNKEALTLNYGGHQVIQGWDTGFEGMHVGGKRRLFIPYQLAYGDKGRPPVIPERAMLIFDVEIVGQNDPPPPPPPPAPPTAAPAGKPATPPPAATKPAETAKPADEPKK